MASAPVRSPVSGAARRVAVLGLGLSGACVIRALALRAQTLGLALEVDGHDLAPGPGQGASGNPVGIFHPLLSRDHNLGSQLVWQGVQTTTRWLEALEAEAQGWAGLCGVVQLARSAQELEDWQAMAAYPEAQALMDSLVLWTEAEARAALGDARIQGPALLSQVGGWVQPRALIQACLSSAQDGLGPHALRLHWGQPVPDLATLMSSHDAVVVCTAQPPRGADLGLALTPVAGQLSWLDLTQLASDQLAQALGPGPAEGLPTQVVCREGYVCPPAAGVLAVGASFDRSPQSDPPPVLPALQDENLQRLREILPGLADRLAPVWPQAQGRSRLRWATRDRLPHIGQPVDLGLPLTRQMSQLAHLPRVAGLHVLMGLGSRGLSFAPLGAEQLAHALLPGTAADPLPARLRAAVDPARFVLRAHRRAN